MAAYESKSLGMDLSAASPILVKNAFHVASSLSFSIEVLIFMEKIDLLDARSSDPELSAFYLHSEDFSPSTSMNPRMKGYKAEMDDSP